MEVGITNLPDEVLVYILSLVSPYEDLHNCAQVCHQWRNCVTQVVSQKKIKFLKAVSGLTLIWTKQEQPCEPEKKLIISKRYSHSAVYDETDNKPSVFVFGGCTSTSSTYNDLWRLDATTREWYRPVSSGTPPSPKACATLVISRPGELMLFGGWSHPSRYPLHQSWRLFNELHSYDIREMKWTHILPASNLKPPTMAGHSATVHNGHMIVFGGLQKQRNNIGQFSSSNDVWSFHLDSETWTHEDIPEPRPKARYGQSQLKLDEDHLLIIGGCGGPNNIYNDVWLLIMKAPHWKWVQCDIKNPEHGSNNMWCHPACKIGDYAVVLGKNLHPKAPQDSTKDSWNFIPQAQRGLNRGHGAIRRPNIHQGNPGPSRPPPALPKSRTPPPEDEDDTEMPSEDDDSGLAIEPVKDGRPSSAKSSPPVFRSSVHLNINASEDSPAGAIGGIRRPMPRMAAFAVGVPSTSNAFNDPSQPPSAKRKQIETRQRQLDSLKRMEERYKNLQKEQNDETGTKAKEPKLEHRCCPCHRMSMFVLDISQAVSNHEVKWLQFYSNNTMETPEVAILYSLVVGRGELIMFGGLQKDVASMRNQATNKENDSVTNALYFLSLPNQVV